MIVTVLIEPLTLDGTCVVYVAPHLAMYLNSLWHTAVSHPRPPPACLSLILFLYLFSLYLILSTLVVEILSCSQIIVSLSLSFKTQSHRPVMMVTFSTILQHYSGSGAQGQLIRGHN